MKHIGKIAIVSIVLLCCCFVAGVSIVIHNPDKPMRMVVQNTYTTLIDGTATTHTIWCAKDDQSKCIDERDFTIQSPYKVGEERIVIVAANDIDPKIRSIKGIIGFLFFITLAASVISVWLYFERE